MKTFNERLLDYMSSHPMYDVTTVYDQTLDKHKRAIWKMQHRIKSRIQSMLTSNETAFFITLTYSDEFLPCPEKEKDTEMYVLQFLHDNNCSAAVANSDYGKENGRFHWHAVATAPNDMSHELWKYGAVNFKRIPKTSLAVKLARYLLKLRQHATKVLDPLMLYFPKNYRKGGEDE